MEGVSQGDTVRLFRTIRTVPAGEELIGGYSMPPALRWTITDRWLLQSVSHAMRSPSPLLIVPQLIKSYRRAFVRSMPFLPLGMDSVSEFLLVQASEKVPSWVCSREGRKPMLLLSV